MNSNMAKPEKFGHLPLVYHFKVPLIKLFHIGAKKKHTSGKLLPPCINWHLAWHTSGCIEPMLNLKQPTDCFTDFFKNTVM